MVSKNLFCFPQVTGTSVFVDRVPYRSGLSHDLSHLAPGEWAGLLLDSEGTVRLNINGVDLGPLLASDAVNASVALYPFVDVYGRCQEVIVRAGLVVELVEL